MISSIKPIHIVYTCLAIFITLFIAQQVLIRRQQSLNGRMFELLETVSDNYSDTLNDYEVLLDQTKTELYFHQGAMECVDNSKDYNTLSKCIKVQQLMYESGRY